MIWFSSKTPGFEWLSNFFMRPFLLDGVRWPSVEHCYQAQKYAGLPAVVDAIRHAASASLARKAGQNTSLTPRADWGSAKGDVMRRAVEAKFAQHADLQALLLSTGDLELVHESAADAYWGRLRSGPGENRLGLIVMQIRAELRSRRLVARARSLPEWVVLHVPHDSTGIPADVTSQFALSAADLQDEVIKMTDHSTLDLFCRGVPRQQILRAPVSRQVVDVERFEDDQREPMAGRGMGVLYERASDGRPLRHPMDPETRQALIERWYRPHHDRLTELTCQMLARHGRALIVDAHSFPSRPLSFELEQLTDRPQICVWLREVWSSTPA